MRIAVDTGGTFTDVVLLPDDGGELVVHKLLSTPDDPARAVLEGVRVVVDAYEGFGGAALPGRRVDSREDRGQRRPRHGDGDLEVAANGIIHGSTVATNALLEGKGGPAAFITTAGFEDLLWLRRQSRPELYELEPVVPQPPLEAADCYGIRERVGPDGDVIEPLREHEVARLRDWLARRDVSAVAVCLLHSYANPAHERRIAAMLRSEFSHLHVTVSSELLPEFREYERAATCLVNAACAAPMLGYLGRLGEGSEFTVQGSGGEQEGPLTPEPSHLKLEPSLRIMGSHGGSLPPRAVRDVPARTVLSGPAGGVLGALQAARAAGETRFLSYDMGGTSSDVALCDGVPAPTRQSEIAGLPLKLPQLDIHTVGAGGGSVAWVDAGGALRIGPQSLGADPGPACYGRQHAPYTPAVTDAHAVLGHFPPRLKLGGALELDLDAARAALTPLAAQLGLSVEEAATGVLRVAAAEVARALRRMSVERGHDPRDFALLPFGGMGGLHAAELAAQLGMTRILLPRHPGLLSAVGMLGAGPVYHFSRSVLQPAPARGDEPQAWRLVRAELLTQAAAALAADGVAAEERRHSFSADLRYCGQSHEINVGYDDGWTMALAAFEGEHLRLYGYSPVGAGIELVALRLEARGPEDESDLGKLEERAVPLDVESFETTRVWNGGEWQAWLLVPREALLAGDEVAGPALLTEYSATTLIPVGWTGRALAGGSVMVEAAGNGDQEVAATGTVALSIFRHLYAAIAEEMGARLMRSAYSPNIKERRDFSCALLDGDGNMLAQAAHIPVHLGSMPLSVQAVLAAFPAEAMQPGDMFVLNDPFHGGTHLPDITVVAPVFLPGEAWPRFFTANRAHHADIGGVSPGSMPLTRSIEEEGLRILPQRLDAACVDWICAASRTPGERRGDLQAQLAALELGRARLVELAQRHGAEACSAYGVALLDYSERCMRSALAAADVVARWAAGETGGPPVPLELSFTDYLDDDGLGTPDIALRCELTLSADEAVVDLRVCGPQVLGPLNAVHAICVSAALYCFRCLAQRLLPGTDIPENAGLLRCIRVLTEPGTVADAHYPAAVAGGNVETSQRLVDVIFGALAQALPGVIPAASGGSMNNITIGDARFAYYETLACGAGGGPQRAGTSAIHTHMTNTLNTPIEALEHAYPLRIVRYAVRRGSGGSGLHAGGDGVVRRYRVLAPCTATLLTERRRHAPWGMAGGAPGACGVNTLQRADGSVETLPGKVTLGLEPGDELEIATPGGGGWGKAEG